MTSATEFLTNKQNESESLIVLHNTTIDNLIKSLDNYNGFIAPSLAIINVANQFNEFGNISVIFKPHVLFNGKDKIKKQDNENFVYAVDSYSVRFPEIEYDVSKKEANNLFYNLDNINKNTDSSLSQWDYVFKRDREHAKKYLLGLSAFKLKFIQEKIDSNYKPKLYKERLINKTPFTENKAVLNFLKKGLFQPENKTESNLKTLKKLLEKEKNKQIEALKEKEHSSDFMKNHFFNKISNIEDKYNNIFDDNSSTGFSYEFETSLNHEQFNILMGKNYKYDSKKNSRTLNIFIKKNSNYEKYENFCENILDSIYINPHIKHGKQKLEVNEDNILKYMKKQGALSSEETLTMSLGKSRSLNAKRFYSLEDIYDSRYYLDSHVNINSLKSNNQKKFFRISNEVFDYKPPYVDNFEHNDNVSAILGLNYKNEDQLMNAFNSKEYKNIPKEILSNILEFSMDFNSGNVHYFEGKPLRKVDIREIEAIVLPRNTPTEYKDMLKEMGIKNIKNYTSNDNTDRHRIIKNHNSLFLNEKNLLKIQKKSLKSKI